MKEIYQQWPAEIDERGKSETNWLSEEGCCRITMYQEGVYKEWNQKPYVNRRRQHR